MATGPDLGKPLDIREQIARIDKIIADTGKTQQDIKLAPLTVAFAGLGAGAALFAAGAAFAKLVIG
jgi:hypothetical protein